MTPIHWTGILSAAQVAILAIDGAVNLTRSLLDLLTEIRRDLKLHE
jgi:hypothetical protein